MTKITITITPVTNSNEDNMNNYKYEERLFTEDNDSPLWIDSKYNTTQKNNYFGFVINWDYIMIFRVIDILEYNEYKREHWNKFHNHNVLKLSKLIMTDSWVDYTKRCNRFITGYPRGIMRLPWVDRIYKDEY